MLLSRSEGDSNPRAAFGDYTLSERFLSMIFFPRIAHEVEIFAVGLGDERIEIFHAAGDKSVKVIDRLRCSCHNRKEQRKECVIS